jgi:hypothetical protein
LTKEVKNLSSYAFSGKLRKLLKNLLNYLIKYFKKNMEYDEIQNKLFFTKSPNSKNDKDSVKALNSILDIIFITQQRVIILFTMWIEELV